MTCDDLKNLISKGKYLEADEALCRLKDKLWEVRSFLIYNSPSSDIYSDDVVRLLTTLNRMAL